MKIFTNILLVILVLAFIAALFLLGSWVLMLVWNTLANYFGFKTISFGIAMVIELGFGILGSWVKSLRSK